MSKVTSPVARFMRCISNTLGLRLFSPTSTCTMAHTLHLKVKQGCRRVTRMTFVGQQISQFACQWGCSSADLVLIPAYCARCMHSISWHAAEL